MVEAALEDGDFGDESLNAHLERLLPKYFDELALANMREEDTRVALREHIPTIRHWATVFLGSVPKVSFAHLS